MKIQNIWNAWNERPRWFFFFFFSEKGKMKGLDALTLSTWRACNVLHMQTFFFLPDENIQTFYINEISATFPQKKQNYLVNISYVKGKKRVVEYNLLQWYISGDCHGCIHQACYAVTISNLENCFEKREGITWFYEN